MGGLRPQRRTGLVFQEVPHGTVVVDARTMQAHALEEAAAQVWKYCDGKLDLSALASSTGLPVQEVSRAVAQLAAADLIERPPDQEVTRRALLLGGAGLGAALVSSLVLPSPAMAASGASTPPSGHNGAPPPARTEAAAMAAPPTTAAPASGSPSQVGGLAHTGDEVGPEVEVAAGLLAAGAAMTAFARPKRGKASTQGAGEAGEAGEAG